MNPYLTPTAWIDADHRDVAARAAALAAGATSLEQVAQRCFEFVRDAIHHSVDYQSSLVTCRASDVLKHGTGYCYAKSHLLAALLRANGIPAGLCYQRLAVGTTGASYCLHGLNAVWLEPYGWYRIDARGNKPGVDAGFTPPREQLAFPVLAPDERDLPEIWVDPLPVVVAALTRYPTVQAVLQHLPDVNLMPSIKASGAPADWTDSGAPQVA